ncbi:VOC family protein [Arthrobacter sp. RAF14]|uniref:VOC family protein n=1 Tax=Arthrobacter sp. RAF14 TaxID=3233051 RepID=UPI003F937174
MSAALTRVVVSVRALEPALAFYRDLLGLPAELTPGFAMLAAGNGVQVFLHERESQTSDLSVAATFTVPGLDALCEKWAAQGGAVVDAPETRPWGDRMAVVRDADAHLVCLVEER